jgi:hypothetical protein
MNYSLRKSHQIFFNPNTEQHCENGYILLEQNIRHLKNILNNEKSVPKVLDLEDFLDLSSMVCAGSQNQKTKLLTDDKFTGHEEDFNKFTFIEDYFR